MTLTFLPQQPPRTRRDDIDLLDALTAGLRDATKRAEIARKVAYGETVLRVVTGTE